MNAVVAEAPGKVALLGEYAVLEGVPGLAMAVDRRARVTLTLCAADACRVEAPQLGIEPLGFRVGLDGSIEWIGEVPDEFGRTADLIEYLLTDLHERGGGVGPFRLHIDTAALFHGDPGEPVKLGLGSSAAVSVALDAVFRHTFGQGLETESHEEIVTRLLVPGRRAQGGAGSGMDLAASLAGGLVGYRIDGQGVKVEPLYMPPGLKWLFVWTGHAASTTDLVAAWRQARTNRSDRSAVLLAEMTEIAEAGRAAVGSDDGEALADCIGAYGRIMGKMNDLMSQPVLTAVHRRAMALAEQAGVAYKPSGAGGGDLGIAVSTRPDAIRQLAGRLEQAGLTILPLAMSRRGAEIQRE